MNDNIHKFQRPSNPMMDLLQGFKGSLILVLIALISLTVFFLVTFRVQRVSGTEVGIKVNNVTGDITVRGKTERHLELLAAHLGQSSGGDAGTQVRSLRWARRPRWSARATRWLRAATAAEVDD